MSLSSGAVPPRPAVPALLIDASLQGIQTGLLDLAAPPGQRLWAQLSHTQNMGAVAAIGSLSQTLLDQHGLGWDDLQALVVAHGPGSFTGIKVGLAFIHGIKGALATDLPALGLSTLAAVAASLSASTGGPATVFLAATATHGFVATTGYLGVEAQLNGTKLVDVGMSAPQLLARLVAVTPANPTTGEAQNPAQTAQTNAAPGAQSATLAPTPDLSEPSTVALIGAWPQLEPHLTLLTTRAKIPVTLLTQAEATALAMPHLAETAAAAWPDGFSRDLPQPQYFRLSTAEEKLAQDKLAQRESAQDQITHDESAQPRPDSRSTGGPP